MNSSLMLLRQLCHSLRCLLTLRLSSLSWFWLVDGMFDDTWRNFGCNAFKWGWVWLNWCCWRPWYWRWYECRQRWCGCPEACVGWRGWTKWGWKGTVLCRSSRYYILFNPKWILSNKYVIEFGNYMWMYSFMTYFNKLNISFWTVYDIANFYKNDLP